MSDNLDTLRKTAEAATPGPWEVWKNVHCDPVVVPAGKPWEGITDPKMPFEKITGLSTAPDDYGRSNLEHIATFDPPTVLALLSRLEQAEQAVQRVREMATELRDTPASPESPKYARLLIEGAQAAGADMLHALDGDGRRLADDALGGDNNG